MDDELITDSDDDEDEEPTSIVAVCPISPELAAQIFSMAELDWTDPDATKAAMTAAGWTSTGDYLGELGERAYTPAGHLVYGDDCLAMPFAYDFWIHPDGAWTEDVWADQPGWHSLVDPPPGTVAAQLEAVVATFTELMGPADHDVTHEPRPEFKYRWRYRAWRRGDNVVVVSPGLDPHSYSQFVHLLVQIRSLPSTAPFPAGRDLPNFSW
ncbi:hypothetical protein [Catenulispora subtropica]|uniref:hypothetical protein n=1 Tax=Catenulispora subtropica TaxID=450798 RepID=UPI0031D4D849